VVAVEVGPTYSSEAEPFPFPFPYPEVEVGPMDSAVLR